MLKKRVQEQFMRALNAIPSIEQFFLLLKEKVHTFFKNTLYWSAVVVVGFSFAAVILHVLDVPIVEPVEAGIVTQFAALFAGIIYYVMIWPAALMAIMLAFMVQVLMNYPHGAAWDAFGIGGANSAGGFINVSGVQIGWRLVRDICNIFFSIILVVIALATVLKIESYAWKSTLPKFIIMAIFINFSLTFAGIFTDVATVAMATFSGSFGSDLALGLVQAFGLPDVFDLFNAPDAQTQVIIDNSSIGSVMSAYVVAGIIVISMCMVLLVFTGILGTRIVMLWFLLSIVAVAVVSLILPATSKYWNQWWNAFVRWVLVGPLIAFFMWLTLTMMFGADGGENPIVSALSSANLQTVQNISGTNIPTQAYNATSPNVLSQFLIASIMIIASLKLAMSSSKEVGKFTGQLQGVGMSIAKQTGEMSGRLASYVGETYGQSQAFGGLGGRAARTAGFLGGTVMRPLTAFNNIREGFARNAKMARENAAERSERQAGEYLSNDILDSNGNRDWGATAGRFAGIMMGIASRKNDDFLQINGQNGIGQAFSEVLMAKKKNSELTNAEKEAKDAKDLNDSSATVADVRAAVDEVKAVQEKREDLEKLRGTFEGLDNRDTQYSGTDPAVLATIDSTIAQMKKRINDPITKGSERDTLNARLKSLSALKKQDNFSKNDLLAALGVSEKSTEQSTDAKQFFGDLNARVSGQISSLQQREQDFASKYMGDANADVSAANLQDIMKSPPKGMNILTDQVDDKGRVTKSADEKKKELVAAANIAAAKRDRFKYEQAGMGYDPYKFEKGMRKRVAGVREQIDGMTFDGLRAAFASAGKSNPELGLAALEELAKQGAGESMISDWQADESGKYMEVDRNGKVEKLEATNGLSGAKLFKRAQLQERLGLSETEAAHWMEKHMPGYTVRDRGVPRMRTKGEHENMGAYIPSSSSPSKIIQDINFNDVVLKNAATGDIDISHKLKDYLKAIGPQALKDPKLLSNMKHSVKAAFKDPAVRKALRSATAIDDHYKTLLENIA